jgi:Zn-finger nucleic acid-binding protein
MIVVEFQKIELDFCPACHGAWLDSGELELMMQVCDINANALGDLRSLPGIKTDEKARKCPMCRRGMTKNNMGSEIPVIVDICSGGDGIFFDGGELLHVIKEITAKQTEHTGARQQVLDFLGNVFKAAK